MSFNIQNFKMKLQILVAISSVVSLISGSPLLDSEWLSYKLQFNKNYNETEDRQRKLVWEENKRYIDTHNMEASKGLHNYTMGINSYSDMKHSDFVRTMNGFKVSKQRTERTDRKIFVPSVSVESLPESVNWTAKGYVTEVGNQGQCGSCWAFSTLGAVEGQWFKKTGKLVRLSVQDLMDCSRSAGNDGCCGGLMDQSYEFIKQNKGIDTWESYPYEAKDGTCRFKRQNVGATDTGFVDIKKGSESDLQVAVATIGPIAVAIDASQPSFQQYKSGIYDEPHCSSTNVDHTLLIVGYGIDQCTDYWLAKNSWGTSWGIDGYVWLSRSKMNQCGVATMASYPTV